MGKYSRSWRSLDVKGALIFPDSLAAGMLKRSWSPFQLSSAAHDLGSGSEGPRGKGAGLGWDSRPGMLGGGGLTPASSCGKGGSWASGALAEALAGAGGSRACSPADSG